MFNFMKKIYVVTGQTATGKTSYALELARKVDGELINCDSRQIYQELDIITGKDLDKTTGDFLLSREINEFEVGSYYFSDANIPIWLYDIVSPDKTFSTFDYRLCALDVINDIIERDKTPILVGGTYFYLKHLLYGTVETKVEPNNELRAELITKTVSELQQMLQAINLEFFNQLNNSDKNNPHRLIRKIEILKSNPKTTEKESSLSELLPGHTIEILGFKFAEKEILKKNIEKRVEERLKNGAIEEVKQLLTSYNLTAPGLQTIGYKQVIDYLNEHLSYVEMKKQWITKEIQYAKRQVTFMKQNTQIQWQNV